MRQAILAVALVTIGVGAVVVPASAERPWRGDHAAPARERFDDARVQRRRIEARLQRPTEIELYPPYLMRPEADTGVDARIRRLGELIRRDEQR